MAGKISSTTHVLRYSRFGWKITQKWGFRDFYSINHFLAKFFCVFFFLRFMFNWVNELFKVNSKTWNMNGFKKDFWMGNRRRRRQFQVVSNQFSVVGIVKKWERKLDAINFRIFESRVDSTQGKSLLEKKAALTTRVTTILPFQILDYFIGFMAR